MSIRPVPVAAAMLLSIVLSSAAATAAPREECVEAHGRAQDFRDRGQLARARQTFLTCAQSSCPSLVQQDCARMSEELAALVPSVTFSARDASAADLPATSVYVDDVLLATRLDDGRSYELEPGRHTVRFVHDGRETWLKVVLNQGERGRLLVATFADRNAQRREPVQDTAAAAAPEGQRSLFPLVIAGIGAAATVTGGALFAIGTSSVPDSCSMSTKECATTANDPAIEKAESGVRLANVGLAIGITGAVTLVGGLIWYLVQPSASSETRRAKLGGPLFTF